MALLPAAAPRFIPVPEVVELCGEYLAPRGAGRLARKGRSLKRGCPPSFCVSGNGLLAWLKEMVHFIIHSFNPCDPTPQEEGLGG